MCRGQPYLASLGPDMSFLDSYGFIAQRTRGTSFTTDIFLCCLTPTGIPVEPASAGELRCGGRLSAEGLRLRMALKTVYRAQGRAETPSSHLPRFFAESGRAVQAESARSRSRSRKPSGKAHTTRHQSAQPRSAYEQAPPGQASVPPPPVSLEQPPASSLVECSTDSSCCAQESSNGGNKSTAALMSAQPPEAVAPSQETRAQLPVLVELGTAQVVAVTIVGNDAAQLTSSTSGISSAGEACALGRAVDESLFALVCSLSVGSDSDETWSAMTHREGVLWNPLPEDHVPVGCTGEGSVTVDLCIRHVAQCTLRAIGRADDADGSAACATESMEESDSWLDSAVDGVLEGLVQDVVATAWDQHDPAPPTTAGSTMAQVDDKSTGHADEALDSARTSCVVACALEDLLGSVADSVLADALAL